MSHVFVGEIRESDKLVFITDGSILKYDLAGRIAPQEGQVFQRKGFVPRAAIVLNESKFGQFPPSGFSISKSSKSTKEYMRGLSLCNTFLIFIGGYRYRLGCSK